MADRLDQALCRLTGECGAAVAVIWTRGEDPSDATVVATCPPGLLAPGAPWAAADADTALELERGPGRLASLVPTPLRLELSAPPTAAASTRLGTEEIFLLMVWTSTEALSELPADLRRHLHDDLATLAATVEDARRDRQESDRLRAVMDGLEVGVASVDTLTGRTVINDAAAKLLNLVPGTIAVADFSRAMSDALDAALNPAEIAAANDRLSIDPSASIDVTWRFASSPTHVRIISNPIRRGEFTGRVWMFYDESDRAAALAGSEQSAALLRTTMDSLLDPVVLVEPVRDDTGRSVDFRYRDVNNSTCAYLGLTPEDLIGKRMLEVSPNLQRSALLDLYRRCADSGAPVVVDDVLYDNEILGAALWYDIRANPAGGGDIVLTWRDVTDRHESSARLAQSEERFRLLAENIADVVCHVRDGRFTWISPSSEAVLGAPPEYWVGREIREIVHAEEWAEYATRLGILSRGETVFTRARIVSRDGTPHWIRLHAKPSYDSSGNHDGVVASFQVIDAIVVNEDFLRQARIHKIRSDARFRRLLDNSNIGMCLITPDGGFDTVNPAVCEFFGYDAETLRTKTWQELTHPDYLDADAARVEQIAAGDIDSYRMIKQYIHADGHPIWGDLAVSCLRTPDGSVERYIAQVIDITERVAAERATAEARDRQAEADARYRRLMDSSPIGMALVTADGRFDVVNQAVCDFFGYAPETLRTKTWRDLTLGDTLEQDLQAAEEVRSGRATTYRVTKQYRRADGTPVWGTLSVSALRGIDGEFQSFVSQIIDVTAEVEARRQLAQRDEENRALAARLSALTERLMSEIDSAAGYMASILPGELTGRLAVSSSHIASAELAGDCFDYRWVDDDHLITYVLDVSGHGIESAMVSISVHNLLRSGTLPAATLLDPDRLLGELNTMFQMDRQGGHYFTLWYGVYRASDRTLRYASAGHPPALLLSVNSSRFNVAQLGTPGIPVGMFDDTEFDCGTAELPPSSQLLLYSDGAYELPLPDGRQGTLEDFMGLIGRLAESPGWSLATLIDHLRARTAEGRFDDDCSLVLIDLR